MGKRFTDTDKWKKPFIRTMKAPYKLLWIYILDECDHAGIWHVDFEVAQVKIGEKLKYEEAINFFNGKIIEIDNKEKWFIFDFIEFQYGFLNPANRVHDSVIKILEKYNIDYKNKPLISPLKWAKDKDKDKDKDKKEDKKVLLFPFHSDLFIEKWNTLSEMKKWKSKSFEALQSSLDLLKTYPEQTAILMMQNSIVGEYQGLFEIKTNTNQSEPQERKLKQLQ